MQESNFPKNTESAEGNKNKNIILLRFIIFNNTN